MSCKFSQFAFVLGILLVHLIVFPTTTSVRGQNNSPEFENLILFNITLSVPSNNPDRIQIMNLIKNNLAKIGINAQLHIDNLFSIAQRTVFSQKSPVPIFDNDGYDVFGVGIGVSEKVTWKHFGYLNWNLMSGIEKLFPRDPLNLNHSNYPNAEYWSLMREYFDEFNVTNRMEIFKNMQEILQEDIPVVGLYTNPLLVAQSSEINLTRDVVRAIQDQSSPSLFSKLETDSPDNTITFQFHKNVGGEFVTSPLREQDTLLQMIYQPLYETKIGEPLTWQPLLAKSLPQWNENHTVARIELREDVVFSDGEPFDAHDVNDTYAWYINNPTGMNIEYPQNQLFSTFLNTSDPIRIIDNHTLEFNFSKPYVHVMNLLNYEMIPSHILGRSSFPPSKNIEETIFRDLLKNGTSSLLVGTGPYKLDNFNYNNTNLSITFGENEIYWNGEVETSTIKHEYFFPRSDLPELISKGVIDLAILRSNFPPTQYKISTFENLDLEIFRLPATEIQLLGFNMIHPIFGNGSLTPLGLEDTTKAKNAARYVRHAINTAIPRDLIIDQILADTIDRSHFEPVYSAIFPTTHGYISGGESYDFDLEKAKSLMEKAGYVYPVPSPSSSLPDNISSIENSTPFTMKLTSFIMVIYILMWKKYKTSGSRKIISCEVETQ